MFNSEDVVIVDEGGNADQNLSELTKMKFQLNVTRLSSSGVDKFLKLPPENAKKFSSFVLSKSKLPPPELIKILDPVLRSRIFSNLAHLDLSNVMLPEVLLDSLCEYVSPFSGGYNISRLNVTRCGLGKQGTTKLLNALFANVTLKELLLTGNNCTDASIPDLITMLTKYSNTIQTIALGGNRLTSAGLNMLCTVLERHDQPLQELLLGNNQQICDDCTEELFIAMNKGNNIITLDLSNCGLCKCEWARFLPFMHKLMTLNLSHNCIDDNEFVKLCKGLETCFCLKHLDLSNNRFGGLKCNVIEQMLRCNGALYSLTLSGNRCIDSVWDAIHKGLLDNNTLLDLHCSSCDMSLYNANILCKALYHNDICTFHLDGNPLPDALVADPRAFYTNAANNSNEDTLTLLTLCPLPLNENADVISIASSLKWCSEREHDISLSLDTLQVVENRKLAIEARRREEEELLMPDKYFQSSTADFEEAVNGLSLNMKTIKSVNNPLSPSRHKNAPRLEISLTSPELIAKSDLYSSPTLLREIVTASDLANTSELKNIHIAYGRAPLLIGNIQITSLTTYAQAHLLVAPLVREYVSTIASSTQSASLSLFEDLVNKYSLMDTSGETPTAADMVLRRVWADICEQIEPVLIVRPGNWVKL